MVDRRTDAHTHTHRQTDCNNPRCACAQSRVNEPRCMNHMILRSVYVRVWNSRSVGVYQASVQTTHVDSLHLPLILHVCTLKDWFLISPLSYYVPASILDNNVEGRNHLTLWHNYCLMQMWQWVCLVPVHLDLLWSPAMLISTSTSLHQLKTRYDCTTCQTIFVVTLSNEEYYSANPQRTAHVWYH